MEVMDFLQRKITQIRLAPIHIFSLALRSTKNSYKTMRKQSSQFIQHFPWKIWLFFHSACEIKYSPCLRYAGSLQGTWQAYHRKKAHIICFECISLHSLVQDFRTCSVERPVILYSNQTCPYTHNLFHCLPRERHPNQSTQYNWYNLSNSWT